MKILSYILLIFLFLGSSISANAENFDNSTELMQEYISWIVENSDFEYNGEPLPDINFKDKDILKIYAYGGETVARSERENIELQNILALYIHDNDTILISKNKDLNRFENHHILIHELVHYLQDINGYYDKIECQPLLEKDAYRLQEKWMREFYNENDIEDILPNGLYILMLELSCKEHHGSF